MVVDGGDDLSRGEQANDSQGSLILGFVSGVRMGGVTVALPLRSLLLTLANLTAPTVSL